MKRVYLFCGHYGSGKTNLAVNWALRLRAGGLPVALADIDIVNPYFRSKDSEAELAAAGVKVIALPFANTSVDLPSLPSEVYGLVQRRDSYAVMDIGGDDRGALALGRYVPKIVRENDYEMLFVFNRSRPLTRDAESAFRILREIEQACSLPFTGIVHNTNLGRETTRDTVLSALPALRELCEMTGLPVAFTAVRRDLADSLPPETGPVFPLHLQKTIW